ncbi:MAG: DinB family protein [Acidimicrobiia bacterium]|nr:DinB family protein [Acidimicrobiia bacterium]
MLSCDECGFDGGALSPEQLAAAFDGFGRRFRAPLSRFLPGEDGPAVLRARPTAETWSGLEYAAHVRDALGFYAGRIRGALGTDDPQFEAFDVEAACEQRRYNAEDPASVAGEVGAASADLGALLADLTPSQWERTGVGSDGGARSVRLLAERAAHEGHHHLLDVGRSLRAARERGRT